MNIVADDCCLSCSIFFRGKGGGDLAEPDQQVLPTSSRVLAIQLPYQLRAKPVCHCKLRLLFAGCRFLLYVKCWGI